MNLHRITLPNLAALLLSMTVAGTTWAQTGTKDPAASQQVTKAMDLLYRQGAFEEAEARLLGTLKACGEDCSAPVKARIWMYIGIVRAEGRHKPEQAKQAFESAVKFDRAVQLDRSLASAATVKLFVKAGGKSEEQASTRAADASTAPNVTAAQCSTDADCKGDRICLNQHCAWRNATTRCEKDSDCPGDAVCNNAQCNAPGATTAAPSSTPAVAVSTHGVPNQQQEAPAQPADGQPLVPVRFLAPKSGGNFAVRARGSTEQCAVPCTLNLHPGLQKVMISGDHRDIAEIVVPNTGGDFRLQYGPSSGIYWGTGIAVAGLGSLISGIAVKGSGGNASRNDTWLVLDGAGGAAIIAGGILMLTSRRIVLRGETTSTGGVDLQGPVIGAAPTRGGGTLSATIPF